VGTVLSIQTPEERDAGLEEASRVLHAGGLVAFPTESFYGLAADPRRDDALRRLFALKRRSPDQPLLLLLPSRESAAEYAARVPAAAERLMDRFWPGGLTLVLEALPSVSPLLTAGTGTIGLRLSSHPLATALARRFGTAVTGTSANPSGRPPACSAREAAASLACETVLILDGGPTPGGAGSTVLDVTADPSRVLREGQVSREALAACLSPEIPS
jgi:L-threonylcarbamoyladenylate synthase